MRIYVNGVLEGTVARSGAVNDSTFGGVLAGGGWGTLPAPPSKGASTRSPSTEPHSAPPGFRRITLAGAPATYASTVMADSPAAYWRLGEASGSARLIRVGTGTGAATRAG